MEDKIILFQEKKDCCACGACVAVCPKNAIEMIVDENGFKYPKIDYSKCIKCGLCQKVCKFNIPEETIESEVYALALKNLKKIKQSSSGGAFFGIAEQWIAEGGTVYGAVLSKVNGKAMVKHMKAECLEELIPMLGSKYVHSDILESLKEVKKKLEAGNNILFSGTPCQVAGLKGYLGKEYDNLTTVDLVCHGVPGIKMFQDYLDIEEKKYGYSIVDFKFRTKEEGWGKNAKIVYKKEAKQQSIVFPSDYSSYYELFLKGEIFRENCYSCPFSNKNRVSDLTIGDFWGIEEEHPEFINPNGIIDSKNGVSMLMINSRKGQDVFERSKTLFLYEPSKFGKLVKHNEQLSRPTARGKDRDKILRMYRYKGYRAVDQWFWRQKNIENIKDVILYHLHTEIPEPVRNVIKRVLRRE